jgi:hypothetical protein
LFRAAAGRVAVVGSGRSSVEEQWLTRRLAEALQAIAQPLTPAGQVTADMITSLFPWLNPTIGNSIFTGTDVPLKLHSKAGVLYTLLASAVTKMPDLILSPRKTALGQAQFMSVLKSSGDPATAEHYYTTASSAWSDTSFATTDIRRLAYAGVWGSSFTSILTEDGWTVSFDTSIKEQGIDENGTVDAFLQDVKVMAKCKPVNLTETAILSALRIQGTGGAIGTSLRQATDLVITGTGVVVTIKDAALVEGPLNWGSSTLRSGELGFIGQRVESTGTFGALATIAIT